MDYSGKPGETVDVTKLSSIDSEIGTANPLGLYVEEEPASPSAFSATIPTNCPSEPIDGLTSPTVDLSEPSSCRSIGGDHHVKVGIGCPPKAITPPSPQQSHKQGASILYQEEEWEVVKITAKRSTRWGDDYKVR